MSSSVRNPEIVIFNAKFCGRKTVPKEKAIEPADVTDNVSVNTVNSKIFNIKRARYEIIKYGLTGFNKEDQMNQKIAMAIRLGAKPPKKKCINYKELIEQKMKEKEALKNEKRSQYNLQPLKQRKKRGKKKGVKNQPNSLNEKRSQYNLQPLKQGKKRSKKKRVKNQPNSLV